MLAPLLSLGQAFGITPAGTATVTLAWNPNPETDITGYQLSYGTTPGVHPNIIEAGLNTTTTVAGLTEGTTYYFVVSACNLSGLRSTSSSEISYQIPVTPTGEVSLIPRTAWTLRYANSQASNGFAATCAFDGDTNTSWATDYLNPATMPPHEIQIDLGATYPVGGFRYLPRQDAYTCGNIEQYEFYVSTDGTQWATPVATGNFVNNRTEQEVLFGSKSGRYVRLRILAVFDADPNSVVAELNVLQGAAVVAPPPVLSFPAWAAAANLTDLNTLPLATPQHDGVANLLKYAFRMDAARPDVGVVSPGTGTTGLPCIAIQRTADAVTLRFEYLRRKNSSLTYTPRKSLDMKTWLPISSSTPISVTDLDTEWERVVIAEPCDPATPAFFGRVEVMMPTS